MKLFTILALSFLLFSCKNIPKLNIPTTLNEVNIEKLKTEATKLIKDTDKEKMDLLKKIL